MKNTIFYTEEAIEFIQTNPIVKEQNLQEITSYKQEINNNVYEKVIVTLLEEDNVIFLNYDAYKDKKKVQTTFKKYKFELIALEK